MKQPEEERPKYFQEALSDFMHDAASGGAIRHLCDLGYTTDAIMARLEFPTPRGRVEKTVYRYLTEKGVLLEALPAADGKGAGVSGENAGVSEENAGLSGENAGVSEENMQTVYADDLTEASLCALLRKYIGRNGEENSYVSCPFGTIRRDREARLQQMLACLTAREREYLLGIPWKPMIMYHRLNSRMLEISICLALHSDASMKFYFLKSGEILCVRNKK